MDGTRKKEALHLAGALDAMFDCTIIALPGRRDNEFAFHLERTFRVEVTISSKVCRDTLPSMIGHPK